jgi:hypothetical protein
MWLAECKIEKGSTPFYIDKKPSGKNSSGTQSNGPTSENDTDFCAVIFFKDRTKANSEEAKVKNLQNFQGYWGI